MTKVTIDRALIEQALDSVKDFMEHREMRSPSYLREALRAALAQPAAEPFGYFRAEPFGWTDCAPTDEGAKALYEAPPPARPAAEPVKGLFVDLIAQYPGLAEELAAIVIDAPPAEPVVEPTCKQPLQVHKQTGWVAHKNQYAVPVLFNPYTGEPRDVRDVQSDPQGVLIVPPGKVDMIAASPPPQAEPARTSQDVCTVPLLSDDEIRELIPDGDGWKFEVGFGEATEFARAIEQLVRRKAGL